MELPGWVQTHPTQCCMERYEAYIFMKGEADVLQSYQAKFNEALLLLKNYGDFTENTDYYRQSVRSGQRS